MSGLASLFLCAALADDSFPDPKPGGAPLTSGEFRNNAYTMPKGDFAIHPLFMPSHFGLADGFDLKVGLLSLIGGLNASGEIGLLQDADLAFSVEPSAFVGWTGGYNVGTTVHLTVPGAAQQFNVSVGGMYGQVVYLDDDGTRVSYMALYVPINTGVDFLVSDRTIVRVVATTDVGLLATGVPLGTLAANWNHAAGRTFRISLGVAAVVGVLPEAQPLYDLIGINTLILPTPTFELWWTF